MGELAEKNLVGYLMLDRAHMDESINRISAKMFKTPIYASIYECFENGFYENRETNIAIVQSELLDRYEAAFVNETLMNVADVNLGVTYKSCVDLILDDYKKTQYENLMKSQVPKDASVNDAIRQAISELEGMLDGDQGGVKSVSELVKEHRDEYFKPTVEKNKIYLGLKELDKMVGGIEGGDVAILAARPAVGKSAMALQIIEYNAAKGKRVGYFNLEMKEKQVYERLATRASGIELARIRNATRFLNDEEIRFNDGNDKLSKMDNVFVRSGSATVSDLRLAVKSGRFDLVVLDYLQLLKPNKSRGANRYAEVGDISRGVKAIAMDFDVPIIALSQLNRASEGKEDKEPSMSELRESGDIEQDASVIIMLWNSDKDDRTKKKIKVDKARQGRLGTEELTFNGSTMTFTSVETKQKEEFMQIDDADNPFT